MQHVIDFSRAPNSARTFESFPVWERTRLRVLRVHGSEKFRHDRFQELHSASVRRKGMDSPCRGHIGNLERGEYFCQRFHLPASIDQPPGSALSQSRWRTLYGTLRFPFPYKLSGVLDLSFYSVRRDAAYFLSETLGHFFNLTPRNQRSDEQYDIWDQVRFYITMSHTCNICSIVHKSLNIGYINKRWSSDVCFMKTRIRNFWWQLVLCFSKNE